MKKKYYIVPVLLCLVVLSVCISQCRKKQSGQTSTVSKSESTILVKGSADTSTHFKQIKGSVRLKKLQRAASDSATFYTGSINDSLGSVSITARMVNDSTFINLDYAGALAERVISQTDTLLHNTLDIREEDSPWYDSFAVGMITSGVIAIIYLILHTTL
jgi:hypothetical protein